MITLALLVAGSQMATAASMEWATGPSQADEGEGDEGRDWSVEVIPYLWVVSLNGSMRMPPVGTIPVTVGFDQLASNLDGAFTGFLDARYRRWHLISDNSWVRLKLNAPIITGPNGIVIAILLLTFVLGVNLVY